jgi:hypothetical protein
MQNSPLATNPAANDDFQPTEPQYYTTEVVPAAWPALLGLGACLALLLGFSIWRAVRACRGRPLHRAKSPAASPTEGEAEAAASASAAAAAAARPPPVKAVAALRITVLVLLFGVLVGSIYGMVKVNAGVVDQGVGVVTGVKSYLTAALGAASAAVAAGDGIDAALLRVQGIMEVDVNVTGE